MHFEAKAIWAGQKADKTTEATTVLSFGCIEHVDDLSENLENALG